MGMVHDTYDDTDGAYETLEQQTLLLRALQCMPRDARLDQASARALEDWVRSFQRQRALIGLLTRGLARLEFVDDEPTISMQDGAPLASLEELRSRGELPKDWMSCGRPLPDA